MLFRAAQLSVDDLNQIRITMKTRAIAKYALLTATALAILIPFTVTWFVSSEAAQLLIIWTGLLWMAVALVWLVVRIVTLGLSRVITRLFSHPVFISFYEEYGEDFVMSLRDKDFVLPRPAQWFVLGPSSSRIYSFKVEVSGTFQITSSNEIPFESQAEFKKAFSKDDAAWSHMAEEFMQIGLRK